MLEANCNTGEWRRAVYGDTTLNTTDKFNLLLVCDHINWRNGWKSFRTEVEVEGWIGWIAGRYGADTDAMMDAVAVGLDKQYFEMRDLEGNWGVLYRSLPQEVDAA